MARPGLSRRDDGGGEKRWRESKWEPSGRLTKPLAPVLISVERNFRPSRDLHPHPPLSSVPQFLNSVIPTERLIRCDRPLIESTCVGHVFITSNIAVPVTVSPPPPLPVSRFARSLRVGGGDEPVRTRAALLPFGWERRARQANEETSLALGWHRGNPNTISSKALIALIAWQP